jgi:hypothetical protein
MYLKSGVFTNLMLINLNYCIDNHHVVTVVLGKASMKTGIEPLTETQCILQYATSKSTPFKFGFKVPSKSALFTGR